MTKRYALVGAAAAAAALLVAGNRAEAGFKINYTVAPGSGTLAGKNVFSFYARNDQTGEQAGSKSLLAMEIHFTTTAGRPFTFDFRDVDGDAKPDANLFGKGFDEASPGTTFMRFGTYAEWVPALPLGSNYKTTQGANPAQAYANVTDFYAVGFSMNQALDATQGLGRFFGAAVVPGGTDVHVWGLMGAEKGGGSGTNSSAVGADAPVQLLAGPDATSALLAGEAAAGVEQGPMVPVDVVARAPEPGALGVVAAASVGGMLGRRRRG